MRDQAGPHLLEAGFIDEFWTGDDPAEQHFVRVAALAFAPDGELVVLDGGERAVIVLDSVGHEVMRWGRPGEGPGEFKEPPSRLAVSVNGVVAVKSFRGVDMFTLDGEAIESHLADVLVSDIAFDGQGEILATVRPATGIELMVEGVPEQVVRLADREVFWSAPRAGPPLGTPRLGARHAILAEASGNRIVVGLSDEYDMAVLDASTGEEFGRISRDVELRGPTEEFNDGLREMGLARATTELERSVAETFVYDDPFPVVTGVFLGPPGRTIWVRRGIGVGDALAPPVGEAEEGWAWVLLLYDLFSAETYEYIGTVEVPEDLTLMAGDSDRVAGIHEGPLGVHSVRVLRVVLAER
ncbi:MAG: hypothetical protein F4Z77_07130 [Dehalococcoidia bacterium]|nr:hypothetical protein [Dehalococcoidia bacterium]